MNQEKLAAGLKAIIIIVGLTGILCFAYVIPILIGRDYFLARYPEFAYAYLPILIAILVSAVPCFLALVSAWKITVQIGRDNSFSFENAKQMRRISLYALIESAYIFIANIVFLMLNMNHPGFVIAFLFLVLLGIMVAIVSACLSHLIEKAALMREENESFV